MIIEEMKSASGAYEETFTLTGTLLTTNSLLGVYYQIEYRWVEISPQNYAVGGRQSVSFVDYGVTAGTKIKFEYVPDLTADVVSALADSSESALDSGTATGGSGTTLADTSKDWGTDIWEYALIEITGGTSKGDIRAISSNTSDTITVSSAFTATPDTTSTYKIFGLSKTVLQNPDDITDTLIASDISLSSVLDYGTASSATSTTLTESTKKWATDVWKGAIVSIVRGTGSGQVRVISSNTSDTITVPAFTTTPDTTSEYKIVTNIAALANAINSSDQVDINIAASDIKVPVDMQAVMKTSLGSTTTALSASASYTGSSTDVSNYGEIVGIAYSDKDGTAYVEYSIDGTNWDYSESFSLTGGTGIKFCSEVVAKYARLKYTNGGTDQTTFRMQGFARVDSGGVAGCSHTTGTGNGTTTDSYADALSKDIASNGDQKITIHLKNTGSTNSLDYQLLSYAVASGSIPHTETSGSLTALDSVQLVITSKQVGQIKVQVKSSTAGSATTYGVEWISA